MTAQRTQRSPARARQAGFTIVEMMVAMAIGLIVMLGFTASFVNMKTTFNSQGQLAQLQDNERLALSMLTTAANEAGYFPNPWSTTRDLTILGNADATYGTLVAGQYIVGMPANGAVPQSLSTAYASVGGDGLLTCQGGTTPVGSTVWIRNVFYVDAATSALGCAVYANGSTTTAPGAPFAPLITNVKAMDVLYGVDSSGTGSIDRYFGPATVPTWTRVKSVRITLDFINPYDATKPTIQWIQTANLMNNR